MLRLAISSDPHSLHPLLAQSIPENLISRLAYDPLVGADARGNLEPALAREVPTRANGGISADGRTITYHLRPDVRWHDGSPLTAADVVASFRAIMDPQAVVASRRGYDQVRRVETPDRLTVRFRLVRPFAPFVATVFSESDSPYYLAPAAVLANGAVAARARLDAASDGTGPFRIVSWRRGDRIVFEANDAYWGGRPALRRIELRIVPDEGTETNALRAGELDALLHISANAAAPLRTAPGLHLWAAETNGYYGVMFDVERPAVRDVRVRRAIAEAIDPRGWIEKVGHGLYGRAVADLPPFLWAADPGLAPRRYDPADARRLLAAAGYGPGRRLAIDLATIAEFQTHRVGGIYLQDQLARVGVDVRLHAYRGVVFSATANEGGVLARGAYDAAIYGWTSGADPDDSGQFQCDQLPPRGYNDSRYCSAAMDAAQAAALGTYDPASRRRAYATIERLLLRDVPIAFLAVPAEFVLAREAFTGFTPSIVCATAHAERWRLAAARR